MSGPGLNAWLLLAGAMFSLGLYGVLTRKNLIALLLSVELMANAANINLVAFSQYGGHPWGQALALFGIALTVAEVVLGLALVILASRTHRSIETPTLGELKG